MKVIRVQYQRKDETTYHQQRPGRVVKKDGGRSQEHGGTHELAQLENVSESRSRGKN